MKALIFAFAATVSLVAATLGADDCAGEAARARWPQFRGPNGAGIGATGFPTCFGPRSNLVWKAGLPAGHSSPCVWDDRIFLTGHVEGELRTICLNREDGRVLWQGGVPAGKIERGAQLGSPATATPVTDGSRVFVYFGAFGLLCYDIDGSEVWRKPLPIPVTQHGAGSSPVLAGNRLFMICDQDHDSYLLVVDARTGETLWKTERPQVRRGFATPLLYPLAAPDRIIVAGTLRLVAYDLQSGAERWSVMGLPNEMVASPVSGGGLIFVAGWTPGSGTTRMPGFDSLLAQGDHNHDGKLVREEAPPGPARQHFIYIDADKDGFITGQEYAAIAAIFDQSQNVALAIRPGGTGDVTRTHVLWRHTRGLPYCPSPLYYDGKIFLVKNGGLATCLDAQSGKAFYQEERLGAVGDYYSSPVAAAGKICIISQPGMAVVYRAGETLEVLARNPLDEAVVASPAIAADQLYVRTSGHLYAFGESSRLALSATEVPSSARRRNPP